MPLFQPISPFRAVFKVIQQKISPVGVRRRGMARNSGAGEKLREANTGAYCDLLTRIEGSLRYPLGP